MLHLLRLQHANVQAGKVGYHTVTEYRFHLCIRYRIVSETLCMNGDKSENLIGMEEIMKVIKRVKVAKAVEYDGVSSETLGMAMVER
ncbi:hypothetical protein EVAR_99850_1 [Eumeta japonica]|uniref:Uncharacterized protein n=1 Tax=Eumeta variegata TaxID=151549 RepID=A0A4C2A2R3_EUMVA|nr:hypothetical protein EVAR_99850_1 [Eumeta japonica]